MCLKFGNSCLCLVLFIHLLQINNIDGNTVTTQISPNRTPFAITSPISFPSDKFIEQSAKKPAIVVNALPSTDTNVSFIAFAIASSVFFSFSKLF